MDADGNDIRHRSSVTTVKDEVHASSTAVQSTATLSTAVHPTAGHSTAFHSTRIECDGSVSRRCGDAGGGGTGNGGEDDQASQVAEHPALYRYGVNRYRVSQYEQGACELQPGALYICDWS